MAAAIAEAPHLARRPEGAVSVHTVAAQWQQWQPLAEQAVRQLQTPADYLAQLVHLDVTARRERRIQRRIQDARFPTLEERRRFDHGAVLPLEKRQHREAHRGPSRPVRTEGDARRPPRCRP